MDFKFLACCFYEAKVSVQDIFFQLSPSIGSYISI